VKKLVLLLSFVLNLLWAQMPVEIMGTCQDPVGQKLLYNIKEQVSSSSLMYQTFEDEYRMQIQIVTLPMDDNYPANGAIYSFVVNWVNPEQVLPLFLTSYVGKCGSLVAEEVAANLVSSAYNEVEELLKAIYQAMEE